MSRANIENTLGKSQRRSTYTIPGEQQTSIQKPHKQFKLMSGAHALLPPPSFFLTLRGQQFVGPSLETKSSLFWTTNKTVTHGVVTLFAVYIDVQQMASNMEPRISPISSPMHHLRVTSFFFALQDT